jgi:hypothetical protein
MRILVFYSENYDKRSRNKKNKIKIMEIKLTREEVDSIILKDLFSRGLIPNTNRAISYGLKDSDHTERELAEEPEFVKVNNDLEDMPKID